MKERGVGAVELGPGVRQDPNHLPLGLAQGQGRARYLFS